MSKSTSLTFEPLAVRAAKAAELVGVSERTFAEWQTGDDPPPHVRRGGCVLYPIHELRLWLSSQVTVADNENT